EDLIDKGTKFFNNILDEFKKSGVDIEDPLQMIVMIKRFNPCKFEESFHPSIEEFGKFIPYHPSVLGKQTIKMKDEIVEELTQKGYRGSLRGKKIICASADGHSYGLMLADDVFKEMNATVINGGVDMEASAILDLADEEGTSFIAVSTHCGQCLDYSRQIVQLSEKRGKKYNVMLGGMMNSMLPGYTEPVDVKNMINEIGVHASNNFEQMVNYICNIG
ncbi:cobalamin-dependent protein, partial [Clostridioides difficile]|uniref:cobalamin-dependent protein n=1 Tax=Clostridioides difficile TaxID=1496 RepID=UPI003F8D044E